ncbi:hypothetical protein K443DRAFT_8738 [Laccaria amethystina LaAM-08-1]|uniref:Uncharacterized protein n=1 Tax=Laccaria amethystina LaAM-08-1 TaxID=1095629 RepID=A0A0C9X1S0_9AGAR|nr:hypothetical protein K443DRAFT_8738 [Laccaria amethystina LaAM-08-1]
MSSAISILRGLKPRHEVHHEVEIVDGAFVSAAAVYSARCISDRFLPDKAIDLVDEAASALRLAQESKPDESESLEREIMTLQIELESLKNESDTFSVERKNKVEQELNEKREDAAALAGVWQTEEARLDKIKDVKRRLEEAKHQLAVAQRQGQFELTSHLRFSTIPELQRQLTTETRQIGMRSQLTEAVRRKPYAVILPDELGKAHKDVSMILLQILDERVITDSQGAYGRFEEYDYCLTSNFGSDFLAHASACNPKTAIVTPEARNEVMERTQEYFPQSSPTPSTQP